MVSPSRATRIAGRTIAAIGALAGFVSSEQAREPDTRFVLLRDADAQTLRFRLNDLASPGYHIVLASKGQFLLERQRDGVAVVEYRVLFPAQIGSLSQDVNTAIALGYRHVPRGLLYDRVSDSPRFGAVMERPVGRAIQPAIARPSSGVPRYEYRVVKNPSDARRAKDSQDGFDVVEMVVAPFDDYGEHVFVLLARVTGTAGAREMPTQFKRMRPEVATLEGRLNELGRQGYRLRLVGREEHFETAVLLERSSS